MLSGGLARNMKSSPFPTSAPTKEFTNSLRGRIRPIKDASDSGSYTGSDSDTVATGYANFSPPAGQSEEGSFDHGDSEKHKGKEVSYTESGTLMMIS